MVQRFYPKIFTAACWVLSKLTSRRNLGFRVQRTLQHMGWGDWGLSQQPQGNGTRCGVDWLPYGLTGPAGELGVGYWGGSGTGWWCAFKTLQTEPFPQQPACKHKLLSSALWRVLMGQGQRSCVKIDIKLTAEIKWSSRLNRFAAVDC